MKTKKRTLKDAEATLRRIQAGGLPPGLSEGYSRLATVQEGRLAATDDANRRVVEDATRAWIVGDEKNGGVLRNLTTRQVFDRYRSQLENKYGSTVNVKNFGRGHLFKESTGMPRGSRLAQLLGPDFKYDSIGNGLFLAHTPKVERALAKRP